jgi:hypothetical protein
MAALEGRAKPILAPMIQAQEVTLTASDQAVVALWAAKTFGLIEASHPCDESLYTTDDYRRMRTRQVPPRRQHIWIAGLQNMDEHQSLFLRTFAAPGPNISYDTPNDPRPPITERRRNYSLVLSIYHLVIQLMTIRAFPGLSPVVLHQQEEQGFVEQIHPLRRETVAFPPRNVIQTQAEVRIMLNQPGQVVPAHELHRMRDAIERKPSAHGG